MRLVNYLRIKYVSVVCTVCINEYMDDCYFECNMVFYFQHCCILTSHLK